MKRKEETKYLDKEWKEMNIHLNTFLETGDQEALHQFRVQIKKLRAMLCLLENTSKKHRLLKQFKPVRKIFKHAGHIRDAYTNLLLGQRYKIKNEAFEIGQQKIIEEGTSVFQSNAKKLIKKIKAAHNRLIKQIPKVDDGTIAGFYQNQLEQIALKLASPNFTEELHDNRKLIKILVYNHKLTDKSLNGTLHLNTAYLDKLQSIIGEWHDNVVASQLFSLPELNGLNAVKKINKKNAKIELDITDLADDFIKKATLEEVIITENAVSENIAVAH